MRADRLVSILLLLQTRGKLTAKTLAQELDVSRRTILRDIEALSIAGVPIYADGGHGGGIALDEGYRTRLTGLHTAEVQALFIANNQAVLRDVGLNEASEQLLLKLLASLPTSHHLTADHIRQRLMIDPTWWWHDAETPTFWDELQRAVYEDRLIDVTYEHYQGDIVRRQLEPYSLVNKSSLWYLVARRNDAFRTYRVTRLHQVHVLDEHFTRLPGFDLPQYWQAHLQEFIQSFSEYRCTLRVHPDRVAFVKWLMPGRWKEVTLADVAGWETLEIVMDSPQLAKMLVFGLGTQAEVVAPTELAQSVLADARAMMAHLQS
ncbi:MAG: WYL domain-containing protein [Anaerolineaceae bacterium]|nr:WYL domain-containing protein [Anaerolineaceae bacterium]